ncbi:hypothetical protein SLEP1_g45419 [Rubroshorea leprosula]|uniref:non-specific serine/threonine protein kinase n=1 Tax=Rubroshorea leprosula TaxID=152421 RepID=A0AAV5LIX4_9ROSI|nr:hypothetical protein SLEP1_g45419 [Rubroshorea leprosula]
MSAFRFFITLFSLSLLSLTIEPQIIPNYIHHDCSNTSTHTSDSAYQSNLNSLLSALSALSVNATATNGFYNTTSGESPDRIYGLFLCITGFSAAICQDCVTFATKEVIQKCPLANEAVIWYDPCLLRYSNKWIFSTLAVEPSFYVCNKNSTDPDPYRINSTLTKAMNEAIIEAVSVEERFATKEAKISESKTLYSLVQCTPDLSSDDCDKGLELGMERLRNVCFGVIGAQALYPSFKVRYELYQFYGVSAPAPGPAPGPAEGPAPGPPPPGSKPKWIPIAATLSAVLGVALLSSFAFFIWRKRNSRDNKESKEVQLLDLRGGNFVKEYPNNDFQGERVEGSQEFPSIQLDIINAATKNFCNENKLGEGGFGPVYKGTLADGKEIAVKRLSRTSGQGLLEFKNEVMLIARVQHRNLVRLLGCCIEDNETLLVYEYMPNRSLDVFLFDSSMSVQLDWQRRFSIITGIARGIMYLHEDSRLRIIHRDLKTSNILLDGEMNPKISDFGMARIFNVNQSEANTNRVVGTYGYMAPEYAMRGLFSVKSDVFSFGVLLLEIISGKKNNGFYFYQRCESLLTFAWKLWSQGQAMQLMDPQLVQSCVEFEVLKCIHIGLLCVQKDPVDRPTMSSVILMLGNENLTLPRPTEPAFFVGRVVAESATPSTDNNIFSANEVTLSDVSPR